MCWLLPQVTNPFTRVLTRRADRCHNMTCVGAADLRHVPGLLNQPTRALQREHQSAQIIPGLIHVHLIQIQLYFLQLHYYHLYLSTMSHHLHRSGNATSPHLVSECHFHLLPDSLLKESKLLLNKSRISHVTFIKLLGYDSTCWMLGGRHIKRPFQSMVPSV